MYENNYAATHTPRRPHPPRHVTEPLQLSAILAKRPDWRKDYNLSDWLPKWIAPEVIRRWKASLHEDPTRREAYYKNNNLSKSKGEEQQRDAFFWNSIVVGSGSANGNNEFAFANANIGLGHRLAHLSYSYTCQVTPRRQQQLIHWVTGGINDNRGWHHLFQDSPVLAGVPPYWNKGPASTKRFQAYRSSKNITAAACGGDYSTYYPLDCGQHGDEGGSSGMCQGYKHPRDLWLLRFAKEPSAQEFYQLLRAQTQPAIKEKLAKFMDEFWPENELVIGVHLRAGNGKDDGLGHFDKVNRGDWLAKDLPAAISMVRQHIRMVARSILDRFDIGGNFDDDDEHDINIRGYRIFLATDTEKVLAEFQKQDPTVLSLSQPRPKDGVAIFQAAACDDNNSKDEAQCALQTQESMLMDELLLSSADVMLAESFSNFVYGMPATLALAEGRVFCEAGRAALGGRYITQDERQASMLGNASWWAHPPPNVMPVRCQTSAWAARDRSNLHAVPDVMATIDNK